jgi:hypothetical protein
MKKPIRMPRRLKTTVLGASLLALLSAPSARAADEKTEFTYDGEEHLEEFYEASNGSYGSQSGGTYIGSPKSLSGRWFSDFFKKNNDNPPNPPYDWGIWPDSSPSNNRLIIDYSKVIDLSSIPPHLVFGGVASSGNDTTTITGNEVHYTGGSTSITDLLVGGLSNKGDVTGNKVFYYSGELGDIGTIDGMAFSSRHSIFGGLTYNGNATGNEVTVESTTGGGIGGSVYGGYVEEEGSADNNKVRIDDGTVEGNVYGGHGDGKSGSANDNEVRIDHGTVKGEICGGCTSGQDDESGPTNGNKVRIDHGSTVGTVRGGYSHENSAENNKVRIDHNSSAQSVVGGISQGNGGSANNKVRIDGSTVGMAVGGMSKNGSAINNKVRIGNGSTVEMVIGGQGNTSADDNEVYIDNSIIGDSVFGGYYVEESPNTSSASRNKITIRGSGGGSSNISGRIVGGMLELSEESNAKADNNSITLTGSITFESGASLYGYLCEAGKDGIGTGTGTGNILNVHRLEQINPTGKPIDEIKNFQEYNFQIDRDKVNQFALTAQTVEMGNAQISIEIGEGGKLEVNDTVKLIQATTSLSSGVYETGATVKGQQGLSFYDIAVKVESNGLVGTVGSVALTPATQALTGSWLTGPDFLNRGTDLLEREVIRETSLLTRREPGPAAFALLSYSDLRHHTGPHIDVKGPSLVVGTAGAQENADMRLTVGGFLEAGWGSYDSHGRLADVGTVEGKGHTRYYGLGLLARLDRTIPTGQIYTEGTLRVGRMKTDFSSNDISRSETARYTAEVPYYGLHIGIGHIEELKNAAALDLSSKLLWTRTGSDKVSILGDPVEFDAVDSLRWRTGLRYSQPLGEKSSFYVGAAYEHEFDGKAQGKADGMAIIAPEMKGDTGTGEMGMTLKDKNRRIDFKVEGYTGRRQGFSGSVQVNWFF